MKQSNAAYIFPPAPHHSLADIEAADQFNWFDRFCLWYPPAWLILFNRHWQRYHADPEGWNWIEYGLFLIPGGFYIALLLRWLRLGCRAPSGQSGAIDPHYQQAFRTEILMPIAQRYFRAELHQLENLPSSGRLIVILNHPSMCFPWDFLGLGVLLSQVRGWVVQPIAHDLFFDHPWLRWWLPAGWSQVLGGVRAERDSFAAAIDQADCQTVLLYAPEGWRSMAEGWRHRYHLTTFDPSFVRFGDRYQIPILPVACLGSEWLHPWTINARRLARWLKMPLFPFSPLLLAFLLFPSLGVWANRTRLRYHIQPVVQPVSSLEPQESTSAAYQRAQDLRSQLQEAIDRLKPTF